MLLREAERQRIERDCQVRRLDVDKAEELDDEEEGGYAAAVAECGLVNIEAPASLSSLDRLVRERSG